MMALRGEDTVQPKEIFDAQTTPVKLLFIEDDEMDRRAFFRMVKEKNLPYEISLAETLAEARKHLHTVQFDLIVSDYHLPDGNSTELFGETPDIPFVLLTGTLEESLALRTLERGADDYLPKAPDQSHVNALPFTIEKTLHRKNIREREKRLTRQLLASEDRFRLLVESVNDYAIYMLDRDGYVTTWNVGAQRIKGWTEKEVLGRHFSMFFLPEDVAAGKPKAELETAAGQGVFKEEARRVRKDGSTFWADVTVTPIRDDHNELIGFGKVTHDISERKRAEEALQQTAANLQLALNAAHFAMWTWEVSKDTMDCSHDCRRLFGLPLDGPLTYTRFLQSIHPEDRQRVDEGITHALTLRTIYKSGLRTLWPNGSVRRVEMIGRGYYSHTGQALRMAGVAYDLASAKAADPERQDIESTA